MRTLRFWIPAAVVCAAWLLTAQDYDRDKYARDYIRFQVEQLNQWNKEFPQQFYMTIMKPPIDASKLSEGAKAGAGELGDAMQKLAALSAAPDVATNAEFRAQLEKTIGVTKELNQAMSAQRFPAVVFNDWDQIRSTLNNLARLYKLETLAVLEAPGGGGGRGGRGGGGRGPAAAGGATATAATGPVPGGLAGYIVDAQCAKRGKGMWINAECVARCVRDGDKVVLVTEEGKVFQISNQDKIQPETYGQVVTLLGKTDGDTITVDGLKQ
jgi:hypothetical protein